jgi:hypothetical protein
MNTATAAAPETFDGFVGQDRSQARQNPHAQRFAYMPGAYYAQSNPRTTGYVFFPQGELITFRTFPVGGHYNSAVVEDSKAPSTRLLEITAEEAITNAGIEYPIFESIDQGFKGIPELTGNIHAADYFSLLHPPFSAFDYSCPAGLTVCPTCRAQWLESDASKDYYNSKKAFDDDRGVALAVKEALYDSCTRFKNYCEQEWRQLADGYERSRNAGTPFVMDNSHHHTRRCIHQPTMEDRELNKIREMSASTAASIGEAVRGVSTPQGFSDAELAMIYAERAKRASAPEVTTEFNMGTPVLCEGEKGSITEVKTAGWFAVTLESGEIKTVRKDKLETI